MTEVSGVAPEIERKYLLSALPHKAKESPNKFIVEHGWIPGEVIQERITWNSRGGGEYWRAIKFGKGIERLEAQERLSSHDDLDLWFRLRDLTTKRISKTRFIVDDGGFKWEIDFFHDRDLVLAEIEIPSIETPIVFPDWLKPNILHEVTDDPAFLNINLAK